jgi:hypothetical protein
MSRWHCRWWHWRQLGHLQHLRCGQHQWRWLDILLRVRHWALREWPDELSHLCQWSLCCCFCLCVHIVSRWSLCWWHWQQFLHLRRLRCRDWKHSW